jgi:adenine specific DNA methylase Mod
MSRMVWNTRSQTKKKLRKFVHCVELWQKNKNGKKYKTAFEREKAKKNEVEKKRENMKKNKHIKGGGHEVEVSPRWMKKKKARTKKRKEESKQ